MLSPNPPPVRRLHFSSGAEGNWTAVLGWSVCALGTWTEKAAVREGSGRRKGGFFMAVPLGQEFYFASGLCGSCGCTALENILLGLSMGPVAPRPSLMLITHPGQPLPAGL